MNEKLCISTPDHGGVLYKLALTALLRGYIRTKTLQ